MAEEEKEEVKGGGSKKLLIIVVLLLVLGGGGVGAFMVLGGGGDEAAEEEKKPKKKPAGEVGPIVDLDGFVVNVQGLEGARFLKAKVSVELDAEESVEPFNKSVAIVRNEILLMLSEVDVEQMKKAKEKRKLEKKIVKALNKRLGGETVSGAYFTEFVMQ